MVQKTLPAWLKGKVRRRDADADDFEWEVTVVLHLGYDIDQTGAAYFMRRFLAKLGIAAEFRFGQPPAYENALGLDTDGGLFDGHASGLSATFLTAQLTGFSGSHEWVRPVIDAISLLDDGKKFGAPFIEELRKIQTFMGACHRQAKEYEKGRTIPEEAALSLGLELFGLVLFEAETRYNAIGFINRNADAVKATDLAGQGKMLVFRVPGWAQTAVNAHLMQQNARVTISVDTTDGFVGIRSRKDELNLQPIAEALRQAELAKRGLAVTGDLSAGGKLVGWFTPLDAFWMVANGTPKFPVSVDEKTLLTVDEIAAVVAANISKCQKRASK